MPPTRHCPGSMGFVQPKPEIFACPACGREVEIWSDEATRECPSCGKTVFQPAMQGLMRKQALARAMEDYFGDDARRVRHAQRAAEYAEHILAKVPEADPNVVLAVAYLHDIGIKNAEAKYGSANAAHQEKEGPPVARDILKRLDYPEAFIKEVCDIIGRHHHPRTEETANFKVLYDADQLVNAEEAAARPRKSGGSCFPRMLTEIGRDLAREMASATRQVKVHEALRGTGDSRVSVRSEPSRGSRALPP